MKSLKKGKKEQLNSIHVTHAQFLILPIHPGPGLYHEARVISNLCLPDCRYTYETLSSDLLNMLFVGLQTGIIELANKTLLLKNN